MWYPFDSPRPWIQFFQIHQYFHWDIPHLLYQFYWKDYTGALFLHRLIHGHSCYDGSDDSTFSQFIMRILRTFLMFGVRSLKLSCMQKTPTKMFNALHRQTTYWLWWILSTYIVSRRYLFDSKKMIILTFASRLSFSTSVATKQQSFFHS